MKGMLTAVVSSALLTSSCSGRDVDLGNGGLNVRGTDDGGTSATTSSTTGPDQGTTSTTTDPGTTGSTATGSGGASGTTGTGTGGWAGGGAGSSGITSPASAIVIRYGDIPDTNPGGAGTSATTGGNPIDPDTPYLFIGNGAPSCRVPRGNPDCGFWHVTIGIPRALFQPGILRLDDPRLISVYSVRGPDRGGGDCSGGGGSFFEGTVEIVDIGPTVHIRLAGTDKFEFNADGAHAANNCQ